MSLRIQRRVAAKLLKCGERRVRFDPERIDEIRDAITRAEIRQLINDGAIYALQKRGQVRGRVKERRGPGRRKGAKYSVLSRKERWVMKVRAQRRFLARLREAGKIQRSAYREVYLQIKAGRFKSIADLKKFLEDNKLLRAPPI